MTFASALERRRRVLDEHLEAMLAAEDPALRDALEPALRGGKRLRPALLLLVHEAYRAPSPQRAERWAVGLELLHTAALIHDDLVDGDDVRRGRPALHRDLAARLEALAARPDARSRAVGLAALAGDAALAWGLTQFEQPAAARVARDALRATWLGAWHEALPATGPGDEAVARNKTGRFFAAACDLGALAADAGDAARAAASAYGLHLGLAYQWADDAADGGPLGRAGRIRRAGQEATRAAALARAFPPGEAGDALREAPRAVVVAALAPLAREAGA